MNQTHAQNIRVFLRFNSWNEAKRQPSGTKWISDKRRTRAKPEKREKKGGGDVIGRLTNIFLSEQFVHRFFPPADRRCDGSPRVRFGIDGTGKGMSQKPGRP